LGSGPRSWTTAAAARGLCALVVVLLSNAFLLEGRESFFPAFRPVATWLRIRLLAVPSMAVLSTNSNFIFEFD
jgi:hypothetical protein